MLCLLLLQALHVPLIAPTRLIRHLDLDSREAMRFHNRSSQSEPAETGCSKAVLMKSNPAYKCEASADHGRPITCKTISAGFPPNFGPTKDYLCCQGVPVDGASTCSAPAPAGGSIKKKDCKAVDARKKGVLCPEDVAHLGNVFCKVPFPPGQPAEEYMCCDGALQLASQADCASEKPAESAKQPDSKSIPKPAEHSDLLEEKLAHFERMYNQLNEDGGTKEYHLVKAISKEYTNKDISLASFEAAMRHFCSKHPNSKAFRTQPECAGFVEIPPDIWRSVKMKYTRIFQNSEYAGTKESQTLKMVDRECEKGLFDAAVRDVIIGKLCAEYADGFASQPACAKHKPKIEIPAELWRTVTMKYKRIFQNSEYAGTKEKQTLQMLERECQKKAFDAAVRDAIIAKLCAEYADGFKDEPQCKAASGEKKVKTGTSKYLEEFVKSVVNVYVRRPTVLATNRSKPKVTPTAKLDNPIPSDLIQALTYYNKNRFIAGEVAKHSSDWEKATDEIVTNACACPCTTPYEELQSHSEWDLDGDGEITMLEALSMCDACKNFFSDLGRKPIGKTEVADEAWNRYYGPKQAAPIEQYMKQLYSSAAGEPLTGEELQEKKVEAGVMGMVSALVKLFPMYGKLPQFLHALEYMTMTYSTGQSAWRKAIDFFATLDDDHIANAYKANCAVMPKLLGLEETYKNETCLVRVRAVVTERNFKNARCLAMQGREAWDKFGLTKADADALLASRIAEPEGNTPFPFVEAPTFVIAKPDSQRRGAFVQADMETTVGGFEPEYKHNSAVANAWRTFESDVQSKYLAAASIATEIKNACGEGDSCHKLGDALERHLAKARAVIGGESCAAADEACIFEGLYSALKKTFRNSALNYVEKFSGPWEAPINKDVDVWELLDKVVQIWRSLFDRTVPAVKSSLVDRWLESSNLVKKCGLFGRCMGLVHLKRGIDIEIQKLQAQMKTASKSDAYTLESEAKAEDDKKTWIDNMCSGSEAKGFVDLCAAIQLRKVRLSSKFPPSDDDAAYNRRERSVEAIWCNESLAALQEAAAYALGLPDEVAGSLVFARKEAPNKYKTISTESADLRQLRESGMEFWVNVPDLRQNSRRKGHGDFPSGGRHRSQSRPRKKRFSKNKAREARK